MKINKEKLDLASSKGIELIVLFGSRVEKSATAQSDYDIAVLTEAEKNIGELSNYSNILLFLRQALNIPDYKIDLTNINNANPLLLREIFSQGKLLYGNPNIFAEYRAFAFREYLDAQSLFELEHYMIEKRHKMLKQLISNQF